MLVSRIAASSLAKFREAAAFSEDRERRLSDRKISSGISAVIRAIRGSKTLLISSGTGRAGSIRLPQLTAQPRQFAGELVLRIGVRRLAVNTAEFMRIRFQIK